MHAEEEQKTARAELENRYADFLAWADEEVLQLEADAKDDLYQRLVQAVHENTNTQTLTDIAQKLDELNGYQDSEKLANLCRNKIKHIQEYEERVRQEKLIASQQLQEKREAERRSAERKLAEEQRLEEIHNRKGLLQNSVCSRHIPLRKIIALHSA